MYSLPRFVAVGGRMRAAGPGSAACRPPSAKRRVGFNPLFGKSLHLIELNFPEGVHAMHALLFCPRVGFLLS